MGGRLSLTLGVALLHFVVFATSLLEGSTYVYIGPSDSVWGDRYNWFPNSVPGVSDTAVFDASQGAFGTSPNPIICNTFQQCDSLRIGQASVTIDLEGNRLYVGSLDIGRSEYNSRPSANLTVKDGALSVSNTLCVGYGTACQASLAILSAAAVEAQSVLVRSVGQLNLSGSLVARGSSDAFTVDSNGLVNLTGGSLTVPAPGASLLNNGVICGTGNILAAINNTSAGEIRTIAGNCLRIQGFAAGQNLGEINLSGGTVEVLSAFTNKPAAFINGRDATLRFQGGVTNQGSMGFAFGNVDIFGDVNNATGGRIVISGGARAVLYDDLVNNGNFYVSEFSAAVFFGEVSGLGITGIGDTYLHGDLRPGNSPGRMTVEGNLVVSRSSTIHIEIGGTTPGSLCDILEVGGLLSLDGALEVLPYGGFRPSHNDQFVILQFGSRSGDFAAKTGLDLGDRLRLVPQYTTNSLVLSAVQGGSGTWRYDAGGAASVSTSWIGGLPNGVGDVATFGPVITQPRVVTIDVPTTYGAIVFDNSHRYTVAGAAPIALASPSGPAAIRVVNATGEGHTIAAPLNVLSDLEVTNNSAAALTLSGHLNNAAGWQLAFNGSGEVVLSGPLSNTGNTRVASGTLRYEIAGGNPVTVAATTLTIDPGATVLAGGEVDPFSSGTNHVDVVNNSIAAGLKITAGSKAIGDLEGTGETTIAAGAELTASYFRQSRLVLSGTKGHPARLVIRPSGAGSLAVLGSGAGDGASGSYPVPEPAAWALLAAAGVALPACAWRRRRAA